MSNSEYRPRWLQGQLDLALQTMPVVVLTGARQTGKTTLVQNLQGQRRYLTLDDLDVLDQAQRAPESLLVNPPLTVDEVQRAPELLLAIKRYVDKTRRPGDFLLTGSAQFPLLRDVADSLAGRAVYLDLSPFCPLEWQGEASGLFDSLFAAKPDYAPWDAPQTQDAWRHWVLRGGFAPVLRCATDDMRGLWFGGYVKTYLERDLRDLSNIESLPDFQRLMQIAAQRTGRLLNQAEIARDAGISHATCHRYLNLLETGCQIERVAPFTANPAVALVKSPKLFWRDSGVACWLGGIYDLAALAQRKDLGFWLEQAVFQSLHAWRAMDPFRRRLSFWRTRGGAEVDFVLEQGQDIVALEVKADSRIGLGDVAGLRRFIESQGRRASSVRGIALYGGSEVRFFGEDIVALPCGALFPALASPEER
ncbi:MAG: ATP-binding protein [Lentisphaeria bacterium]|jgi:predicted AAA+ superfamily ATPase